MTNYRNIVSVSHWRITWNPPRDMHLLEQTAFATEMVPFTIRCFFIGCFFRIGDGKVEGWVLKMNFIPFGFFSEQSSLMHQRVKKMLNRQKWWISSFPRQFIGKLEQILSSVAIPEFRKKIILSEMWYSLVIAELCRNRKILNKKFYLGRKPYTIHTYANATKSLPWAKDSEWKP